MFIFAESRRFRPNLQKMKTFKVLRNFSKQPYGVFSWNMSSPHPFIHSIHSSVFLKFRRNPILDLLAHRQEVKTCQTCVLGMHIPENHFSLLIISNYQVLTKRKFVKVGSKSFRNRSYFYNIFVFGRFCKNENILFFANFLKTTLFSVYVEDILPLHVLYIQPSVFVTFRY